MNTGDKYLSTLASLIAGSIVTFHIMGALEATEHPNLYAFPIFIFLAIALYFIALLLLSFIRGDRAFGTDGVLLRHSSDIALTLSLTCAISTAQSGYGLSMTLISLMSFTVFSTVYSTTKWILK